ncbi:hypothetical protein IMZ31_19265 (plasmid) [Pontibacillus sp. ALD_SL1]|uniref:hypothetical protein n=1 Tax=Pontibacillus sp. ALD_SL1 TaxID=2777185 RepID=UPI001A9635B6|nr:hypothetical protein [Pontibacillus sp. ALD_SL1]QST02690.1 hypothetical protein IMZ31_19265 [Pontibacillus sp. ALD_SL1]
MFEAYCDASRKKETVIGYAIYWGETVLHGWRKSDQEDVNQAEVESFLWLLGVLERWGLTGGKVFYDNRSVTTYIEQQPLVSEWLSCNNLESLQIKGGHNVAHWVCHEGNPGHIKRIAEDWWPKIKPFLSVTASESVTALYRERVRGKRYETHEESLINLKTKLVLIGKPMHREGDRSIYPFGHLRIVLQGDTIVDVYQTKMYQSRTMKGIDNRKRIVKTLLEEYEREGVLQ